MKEKKKNEGPVQSTAEYHHPMTFKHRSSLTVLNDSQCIFHVLVRLGLLHNY